MDDYLIAMMALAWASLALGVSLQYFARGLVQRKKRGRR